MSSRISTFFSAGRFLFLPILAAAQCFPAQAKRKDVAVMNNGDHFTGEVKRLQNGLLMVEKDYVTGPLPRTGIRWNRFRVLRHSKSC
jgi:hypothetical protein